MRALYLLSFLLVVLTALASRWYPDFNEGVRVAKDSGKLVLVYFYEDGCSYCKYMEEAVFIEPEVSELMENRYVVVPINVDEIPPTLDKRFRAIGTPTFMIYDPTTDKILLQIFGVHEADEFASLLSKACKKVKRC